MISQLALLAKKTIEAAWLNGPSYDLATQAAEALESAQLLQSPDTAAASERLRVALESTKRGLRWQRAWTAELKRQLETAENPVITVHRAAWDSMPLGLYARHGAARAHCEAHARRDLPTAAFDWIEDEEDGVAELVATVDGQEGVTGYTVTALEVASEYDEGADE
ncbi:hypothetical protein ACR9VJ_18280 [Streptomyces sp. H49]|uniref:hypothetical protein n=1 Tax=Streptomyces sp. H49 TaxID=3444117 RepID=UPI003F4AAE64